MTSAEKISANSPDSWNRVWKETWERCIASGRGQECWQAWSDESDARRYLAASAQRPAALARAADLCSLVQPDWRVLDIGAGPGNITLPLAAKAACVTAVEPAPGMMTVLRGQVRERGIGNVRLVGKKWDDTDPRTDLCPPYDLSFASFSLGMTDLRSGIEKMIAVTRREIVLFWHAGVQSRERDSLVLWPLLHGREFEPVPKSDIVFSILYAMGIYPDIKVLRSRTEILYDSFEDALEDFARRYDACDAEKKAVLSDYLGKKLVARGTKKALVCCDTSMRISWKLEDSDVF